jgi:hypothetical protein
MDHSRVVSYSTAEYCGRVLAGLDMALMECDRDNLDCDCTRYCVEVAAGTVGPGKQIDGCYSETPVDHVVGED